MKVLLDWKHNANGKYALLIEGARRVGKSYVANELRKEYRSSIFIDFNTASADVKHLFEDYLSDLDTFFLALQAAFGTKLYPRESLIVFDEVQIFPRARSAIKYLVADGRYDYLETGSLISIRQKSTDMLIPSEERRLQLFPMDFEEFLWAMDATEMWNYVRSSFREQQPLLEGLHRKAMDFYRRYLLIGGMPQAVQSFLDTQDFEEVDAVKRSILDLYREDMEKYTRGRMKRAQRVFDSIPAQLSRPHVRFSPGLVQKNARTRDLEGAVTWLEDAMLINVCWGTLNPMIGFALNRDVSAFKCYMGDTGLLISMAFADSGSLKSELYRRLLVSKLEVDEGMIAENMVAQMLRAAGHRLYYYQATQPRTAADRMEIDFLITKSDPTNRHNVCPIEVKSGKSRTTKSLDRFCSKFSQQVGTSYIVSRRNYSFNSENGRTWLPFYMVPLI